MSLNMDASASANNARTHYARPPTARTGPASGPGTPAGSTVAPRFHPSFWPTLAALLLIPLFIAAGNWQWNKAERKAETQRELDARGAQPTVALPATTAEAATLQYRTVSARGRYEPALQILIDNRTHAGHAGYHVVTPLHLEGSDMRVLVNRGWLEAPADHSVSPVFATPTGPVDVVGTATVPPSRVFTLGNGEAGLPPGRNQDAAPAIWQNLDLARYAKTAAFPVQPVVVQLDPQSDAGGFVRDWGRADDRRQMNLGYAFQWWTFAATTFGLWLIFSLRRPTGGG